MSPKRFSRNSGRVREFSAAKLYRRIRRARMVQANQWPRMMLATVHRCIIPAAKARAGRTSMVQPLVADEAALRAEVKKPILRPPST